ncbi:hypothetical protein C8T65DRAFT_582388 [Cerioporus squamosus]|nr:hypothetical protein C8T65DRAFT_582388 [Cerioporus squamosus]
MFKPVEEGGLNVLDLKARNDAIDVICLKEYLDTTPSRPKWVYLADALMSRAILQGDSNVEPKARINKFLQTWDVSLSRHNKLPEDLRRMVKVAGKYGLKICAKKPAKVLRLAMPVWYHVGKSGGRSVANTLASKCLRENHGVCSVLDALVVARRLNEDDGTHRQKASCACALCQIDRNDGCDNPHRCAMAAMKMTEKLHPVWNPWEINRPDGLTLTGGRVKSNAVAASKNERIAFNPTISEDEDLADLMRIFVNGDEAGTNPVRRLTRPHQVDEEEIEVYTDGAAMQNGMATACAGSAVWYGVEDPRNLAVRTSGPQTNQAAEMYAVSLAVDSAPPLCATAYCDRF